jgi:hypothetical protein
MVSGCFILVMCVFQMFKVVEVSYVIYAGLIVMFVGSVLLFGLCVFCAIVYKHLHRRFLIGIVIVFSLGVIVLAALAQNFAKMIHGLVEDVWSLADLRAKDVLERRFACRGFDPNWVADEQDASQNCAPIIESFLLDKAHLIAKYLGGFSGGSLGLAVILLLLGYKLGPKADSGRVSELMRFHSRDDEVEEDEVKALERRLNTIPESIEG